MVENCTYLTFFKLCIRLTLVRFDIQMKALLVPPVLGVLINSADRLCSFDDLQLTMYFNEMSTCIHEGVWNYRKRQSVIDKRMCKGDIVMG